MKYSTNKDLDQYVKSLVDAGWVWEKRRNNHNKLTPPWGGQRFVVCPYSPSDRRGILNLKGDVRRLVRAYEEEAAQPKEAP